MEPLRPAGPAVHASPRGAAGQREPANLADILERVLDRGVVIAGDIRVNLLDIELLTIKLRLIVASVDTAKEMGIDWWEHDPWLTGRNEHLEAENRRLRRRLAELEDAPPRGRAIRATAEPEPAEAYDDESEPARRRPETERRHDG
ncbi:gas vesicle protein [Thermopolyspora sp. NPDC052614]|uniref:gas vesicle protein n=1 Tax=Thermopolyspora sp. NPDC052614 TaxID=3155682 RepID=UPI00341D43D1